MTDQKNVFTEMNGTFEGNDAYQKAGANYKNSEEFIKLLEARRSVRKFENTPIPDEVVEQCLDMALLAPNSSNLQTWKFYRIKNSELKKDLAFACFSQPAASTAAELIVCVAEPYQWKLRCKQMLETFNSLPMKTPKSAILYYKKLAPFVYTTGPLNILTPLKWLFNLIVGTFKVVPREPISSYGLKLWASKSCALACENLMLAFRSHGYDTCPMEGYDSSRVKRILGLKRKDYIVMIIGAGVRAEGGIYGPRIRFDRSLFIKTL